jgi:hypothetical protein
VDETLGDMHAQVRDSGDWLISLSAEEAVTLHELIAFAEWAIELNEIETRDVAERQVLSRLQQALAPLVPRLGTDAYDGVVQRARDAVNHSDGLSSF